MSFHSRHMELETFEFGRVNEVRPIDLEFLKKTTWKTLLSEDISADGNTKWSGDKPLLAFIKNNLFITKAAAEIGYAQPEYVGGHNLARRIRKRGVERLLPLLMIMIAAKKMPVNCSKLLKKRTKPAKLAIEFANEIIETSIKNRGSREEALLKLGIDDSLARWWESRL